MNFVLKSLISLTKYDETEKIKQMIEKIFPIVTEILEIKDDLLLKTISNCKIKKRE